MKSKPALSRRHFVQLLGSTLGGVTLAPLTGCGGDDDDNKGPRGGQLLTEAPLPNGYRFFPIIDVAQVPITPGVMINDSGVILLYSIDESSSGDATGSILEFVMNFSADTPTVASLSPLVSIGDTLEDGRRVDRIGVADTNRNNSFIVVLDTYAPDMESGSEKHIAGVYMERNKSGLKPLVGFRDSIPDVGQYGGSFGDVALNDHDDVLLVSHFTLTNSIQSQQGLICLPNADPLAANTVLQTGQMIPQSNGIIHSLGLTDLSSANQCVVQVYGHPVGSGESVWHPSALLQGSVDATNPMTLLCASPFFDQAAPEILAETMFGPRLSATGVTAYVHHLSEGFHALTGRNNTTSTNITEMHANSPLHATVQGLSAPVIGHDGLIYQQIYTNIGQDGPGIELIASNGKEHRTLLTNGDLSYQGLPLLNILHGFHSKQVDAMGRIVFMAEFGDGLEDGVNTQALVVGIPV